jgi:prepilin-type N-terminal cleavage/methylation domain-containing protein
MRKRGFTLFELLTVVMIVAVLACVIPAAVHAGDVVSRTLKTWTTATGTSITTASWDHWTVDKVDFYGLNPTNTTVTVTVVYGVGAYTQTVGTCTGDTSGNASFTTDFPVAPGETIKYTPAAASTGSCVTTYLKQNP